MTCFEVHRNGEKLCTAGVDKGMASVACLYATREDRMETYLFLMVNGITSEGSVNWVRPDTRLNVGDEIIIRVVSAEHSDEPAHR